MITLCVLGTAEEILSTADDLAIGLGECRPSSVVATAQITVMGPIPSQSLRYRKCQLAVQGQSLSNTSVGSRDKGRSGLAYVDYAASQGESFGQYC